SRHQPICGNYLCAITSARARRASPVAFYDDATRLVRTGAYLQGPTSEFKRKRSSYLWFLGISLVASCRHFNLSRWLGASRCRPSSTRGNYPRSEERRVGKERRARWSTEHEEENE